MRGDLGTVQFRREQGNSLPSGRQNVSMFLGHSLDEALETQMPKVVRHLGRRIATRNVSLKQGKSLFAEIEEIARMLHGLRVKVGQSR